MRVELVPEVLEFCLGPALLCISSCVFGIGQFAVEPDGCRKSYCEDHYECITEEKDYGRIDLWHVFGRRNRCRDNISEPDLNAEAEYNDCQGIHCQEPFLPFPEEQLGNQHKIVQVEQYAIAYDRTAPPEIFMPVHGGIILVEYEKEWEAHDEHPADQMDQYHERPAFPVILGHH